MIPQPLTSKRVLRSLASALIPAALLAVPATADVLNLNPGGMPHASLQSAIDAASEGDTLLLGPGEYEGFVLAGKGVTLLGSPLGSVHVIGQVQIQNLPASSTVLARGINFRGRTYEDMESPPYYHHEDAAVLTNNTGAIRFFDCEILGGNGQNYNDAPVEYDQYYFPDGGNALVVEDCLDLAILDSRILGGAASGSFSNWDVTGGVGAHGLLSTNSAIAIYDTQLVGGEGGHGGVVGSDAGDAARLTGLGLFSSGSRFQGGDGGDVDPTFQAGVGDGGAGLWVGLGTNVRLLDNEFQGGEGGCCSGFGGAPGPDTFYEGGVIGDSPGTALHFSAPGALAADGESFHLQVEGTPGERVFLVLGAPNFEFVTAPLGVKLVDFPQFFDYGRSAVIGASGTVDWYLPAWELPDGTFRNRTAQAFVRQGSQITSIGGGVLLTAIDDESGPDCNGNGVHDVFDVVSGTSQDCNGDLRPDDCAPQTDCNANGLDDALEIACMGATDANDNQVLDVCEGFANWYVDVNAAPGGDGTAGAPFTTIGAAFTVAGDGHSISVAPGTYSGISNRDLDWNERDLTVFSTGGSATCIIDLGGQGMAFDMHEEDARATIRGFTIENGDGAVSAVRMLSGESTLEDCFFRQNQITAVQSSGVMRLIDCDFQANSTDSAGGAVSSYGQILARGCTFGNNSAVSRGGAINLYAAGPANRLEQCVFRNNTSGGGGALYVGSGSVIAENCYFSSNIANQGGVFFVSDDFHSGSGLFVANSTIVNNSATVAGEQGAVIYSRDEPTIVVGNSILWNNASTAGSNIYHAGIPSEPNGSVDVTYSTVEFGLASVIVVNGTLTSSMVLTSDPIFSQVVPGDYRLGAGSPCIDAGDNSLLSADVLDVDFDFDYLEQSPLDLLGQTRRIDDPTVADTGTGSAPLVDMGAFERL